VKMSELVVQVRCLHCRHQSILTAQVLRSFGIKPDAPLASFIKRLRCTNCRSGSVLANRVAANETAARRLRA
jgi:cytochrome c-type biogenesis protein CcmH/NrfF